MSEYYEIDPEEIRESEEQELQEVEDPKLENSAHEMYDKWRRGQVSDAEYKVFLCDALENYIKSLIAKNHRTNSRNAEFDDFKQAGFLGVLCHYAEYDPNKGKLTTFFKSFINKEMKLAATTNDESRYYNSTISELNKVAQAYGFSDLCDPSLPPQLLYRLDKGKHSINTITNAIRYRQQTQVCSFEALTENQDYESSKFVNPEDAVIQKEQSDTLGAVIKNCTKFEQYILQRCYMTASDGSTVNFNKIVQEFKNDPNFKLLFDDDEVFYKNRVDNNYVQTRANKTLAKFRENRLFRAYGTPREKALFAASDEQASADDISNAFAAGELFTD